MRKIVFLIVLFLSLTTMNAQKVLTWEDFADVTFETTYNEKYDAYFLTPTFGDKIKSNTGKKIAIKGYFLDISGSGDVFLVSRNPLASCFFCGAAGPETIIEVSFKERPPFRTDQVIFVEGTLELNADNVERCNYILNQASGRLVN